MHDEDGPVTKMFLYGPPVVLLMFVFNHSDIFFRNKDWLIPIGVAAGLYAIYKFVPEAWHQLKSFLPLLIFLGIFLTGVMFAIFGGGADSVVEFGSKSREQEILDMK